MSEGIRSRKLMYAGMAIILGLFVSSGSAEAATGINKQINFQGKVVNADGTNVANGSYDFVFKLYSVSSGGTALWTETWNSGTSQVTVTDGVFQVNLGTHTVLPGSVDFNTDNVYLGVTFHTDSEMTPRIRFTAVPYAFNADKIHGLTVTDTTGTLTIPNGETISFGGSFTTTAVNDLTLTTTAATDVTLPTTGTLSTLLGSETLNNKTIGSAGLVFSGAATDITTASGESLVIDAAGAGIVDIQDALTTDSLTTDTGGVTIATGQSYTGSGAVTLSSGGSAGLTIDSASGVTTLATGDYLSLSRSGVTGAAAGYFWYDSSDNKFKINENGTTKVLCNTTDAGCGGGGLSIGDAITSATEGSILFAGASGVLAQDNANFFWNDTTDRLGIGTAAPDAKVGVISTTEQLRIGYDATKYASFTVSSAGDLTIDTTGNDVLILDSIQTNAAPAGSNFWVSAATAATGTTNSSYLLPSAATTYVRVGIRGVTNSNLGDDSNYGSFILGSQSITEGATGTHPLLAAMIARPLAVTDGAAAVTDTSTIYIEGAAAATVTGGNYALFVDDGESRFDGNVGIGDATPAALLTVGASDAFQVNNAGSVTIATGQSYTGAGAVTLSSGGTAGLTVDSASGVTTLATGDYLALSRSGVTGAAAGYFWYDSSDNKFKINENGTTKVLCNTTDAGCGAGGSTSWDTISDAAASGAIAMNEYAQTLDWNTASTAASFDGLSVTITNDASTDSGTQRAFVVANQDDSASTGTTDTIAQIVNRDTDETVGSGLVIENTGAGTMTNALQILETAGTITTAIAIGNNVTTGLSIGTGVTTGISIASGGIDSTGEVVFTNIGAGLSLRVNDESSDTTPFVVDASGNVGVGTSTPSRILDVVQAAAAPQLRLSKDMTYYSEFTVDSVGDLQMAATGSDIRALSENLWICDNDACPALTLTGDGNIFVENVLKFGNGVYIKNDSATELGVYDNDDNAMLVFDEQ